MFNRNFSWKALSRKEEVLSRKEERKSQERSIATMKKYLCCFKGESSGQGAARNPQASGGTNNNGEGGDDGNPQRPFGDNEFLNNAWRNNLEIPDDRLPPGSLFCFLSVSVFQSRVSCGASTLFLTRVLELFLFTETSIDLVEPISFSGFLCRKHSVS